MGGGPVQQGTQQGTTQTSPWGPTGGDLRKIIGLIGGQMGNTGPTDAETNAFNQLASQYGAGNPYANAIGGAANGMLGGGQDFSGGVNDAYDQYSKQIMPWANGSMGDPSTNPALAAMLRTIQGDTANSVNGQFAAAGRDMSGMNSQAMARGLAQGEAPALLQAQQMGLTAAQNLNQAGNQRAGILSGLQQNKFANQQAGTGMAANALAANQWGQQGMLGNEAARRALPLSNIANLNSVLLPIAGLGGRSQSSGQTTQQTQVPMWQQMLGAGMGLTGMGAQTGAFGSQAPGGGQGWLGPGIMKMFGMA